MAKNSELKAKVYLWKRDVVIIDMDSPKANGKPLNSIENASNVISAMLPSGDVEAMCKHLVSVVRYCQEQDMSDYQLENALYNALMKFSTFNK